jgi:hypothetical protein
MGSDPYGESRMDPCLSSHFERVICRGIRGCEPSHGSASGTMRV